MTTFRILILLACFITLSGCAVSSLKLSDTERVSFYDPPDDKALVSVFLACGKQAINGNYDDPRAMFSFPCQYYINGVDYSRISSDEEDESSSSTSSMTSSSNSSSKKSNSSSMSNSSSSPFSARTGVGKVILSTLNWCLQDGQDTLPA